MNNSSFQPDYFISEWRKLGEDISLNFECYKEKFNFTNEDARVFVEFLEDIAARTFMKTMVSRKKD